MSLAFDYAVEHGVFSVRSVILVLAFYHSDLVISFEEKIALPRLRSRNTDDPDTDVPLSATADVLVTTSIYQTIKESYFNLEEDIHAWQLRFHAEGSGSLWYIGIFALEDKCVNQGEAERQLASYLGAIQHHRRALALKDRPVYGAIYVGSKLTLYGCVWDDGQQKFVRGST